MKNRAFFFIDGSNLYHSLRAAGIRESGHLKISKVCTKLAGPSRTWTGTHYYVGRVNQLERPIRYRKQRQYQLRVESEDRRIKFLYGRLERRPSPDITAKALKTYLSQLPKKLPLLTYHDLQALANARSGHVMIEKAVDVMLAVDMVVLAYPGVYDAAYLISRDGDFTPAIQAVRDLGKKVYVAAPVTSFQLRQAANASIKLTPDWLADCW